MSDDRMTQFMKEFQQDLMRDQTIARAEREQRAAKESRAKLRDRFAMAALTGLLAADHCIGSDVARWSYEYADAMLKARGDE